MTKPVSIPVARLHIRWWVPLISRWYRHLPRRLQPLAGWLIRHGIVMRDIVEEDTR